jgi:pyruvate/2-oxoglutarate dehydrogenase complex dihydrolipoamide dehydrogenase (E3) component
MTNPTNNDLMNLTKIDIKQRYVMKRVDVLVIGAGSAGLSVAFTAKGFGKSVIIVDKHKPGGECTWSGCIPSKALIQQANEIHIAKKYSDFEVDHSKILAKVRSISEKVYADESVDVLAQSGIDFIQGSASFKDKKTLEVSGELIEAKRIFICTGSSPLVPNIPGVDTVDYLTNQSFFQQDSLPKDIIILGGGAIGVELAQAMNRLSVKVHVIEMAESILPREDHEVRSLLQNQLVSEGVNIYGSSKAIGIRKSEEGVEVQIESQGQTQTVSAEKLLLALGRVPNTKELNLDAAGIEYARHGIKVNQTLETTASGVYAVGDVVGPYQLSHMANAQGILAIQNALLPIKRKVNYDHVVWCTFTSPELATIGLNEQEALKRYGKEIRVVRFDLSHIDRVKTHFDDKGFVKLILDKKGHVLGCSILAERAGELISEVLIMKHFKLKFAKLATVVHPYPTYAEVFNKMGKRVAIENVTNQPIIKLYRNLTSKTK